MVKNILIAFCSLISLDLFAQTCVDLNGTYRMNLKDDCSNKSYHSIVDDPYNYTPNSSNRIHMANNYGGELNFDLSTKYVDLEFAQKGCDELIIKYERTINDHQDIVRFKYLIDKKEITKDGFKFKNGEISFGGAMEGAGWFGVFHSINKIKIEQTEDDPNTITLKSKDHSEGLMFFLIPMFDKEANFDCKLKKI